MSHLKWFISGSDSNLTPTPRSPPSRTMHRTSFFKTGNFRRPQHIIFSFKNKSLYSRFLYPQGLGKLDLCWSTKNIQECNGHSIAAAIGRGYCIFTKFEIAAFPTGVFFRCCNWPTSNKSLVHWQRFLTITVKEGGRMNFSQFSWVKKKLHSWIIWSYWQLQQPSYVTHQTLHIRHVTPDKKP